MNEKLETAVESPAALRALPGRSVFSFPAVCVTVLTLLTFALSVNKLPEPDFWWHLRNGEQIIHLQTIPRVDTYTFGAAGSPWLDHEWLSEAFYYLAFKVWGLRGVVGLYFALLTMIYAGVYFITFKDGADAITTLMVTSVAVILGSVSFGPRPLVFGWLCLVVLLVLIQRFQRGEKGIWLLPLLFAIWINFHGSWVFGLVVFALTIASGLVDGEWGLVVANRWSNTQLRTVLLVFASSVAGLFVNPFGYKLPLYPFDLLLKQPSNMKFVEEWHSVDFAKGSGKLALITLLALLVTSLFSGRRWRLDEVLLAAFALWMGLSHVRLLFFLGIILTPIIATRLNLFPPVGPQRNRPWLNAAIMALIASKVVFSFPSEAHLQKQVSSQFPTEALEYMQRQHITGRIFNEDWFGGYMEWTAPQIKPFTDSRADIFVYNGTFDDYVRTVRIVRPLEVLEKYGIDYALLEPDQPLVYVLQHSPSWRVLYSDKVAVLLGRSGLPSGTEAPSETTR